MNAYLKYRMNAYFQELMVARAEFQDRVRSAAIEFENTTRLQITYLELQRGPVNDSVTDLPIISGVRCGIRVFEV